MPQPDTVPFWNEVSSDVVAYALDLRRDKTRQTTHAQETSSRTGVIVSTLERPSRRERLDIKNNLVHKLYTSKIL
jgi:hypothetical protein